ncbi:hypothetical protein ACT4ZR_13510 [Acinetobacter baumannii]
MQEILKAKYSRRVFLYIIFGSVFFLLVLRYWVFPTIPNENFQKFLLNFSDGIVYSLLSTLFIGLFIYYFTPKIMSNASIEVVEPRQLNELFDQAFTSTKNWWYMGGCGRYFRTKTLPEMVKRSRIDSLSREIKVIILDPMNDELCQAHANYRASTASASLESDPWTSNKVQNQLYATIVNTLILQMQNYLLTIQLRLASHYSTFRLDLSDNYVIVTKEDRSAPAIICNLKNYYYQSYKVEILTIEKQSKEVQKITSQNYKIGELKKEDIRNILSEVSLLKNSLTDHDLTQIADICNKGENPYG